MCTVVIRKYNEVSSKFNASIDVETKRIMLRKRHIVTMTALTLLCSASDPSNPTKHSIEIASLCALSLASKLPDPVKQY